MCTIAGTKVHLNYNCYNVYFYECLRNTENPFANNVAGFKHYLILNLTIGSNGGKHDDSQFPLRYYIDYVRVYQ